jgi:hypothetical protein
VERHSPEEQGTEQRFALPWTSAALLGFIGCIVAGCVGFILGTSSATPPPQDPAPPRILYRFLPMPDEKEDAPGDDASRPAASQEGPRTPKKSTHPAAGKRAGRS